MPKYSLKRLLIVVTVIACVIGFLRSAYVGLTHFETAEDLSRVDWLPESATHVSYYKSYRFTAYEFDIPEPDFRKWSKRWGVEEISEPVKVTRYTLFAKRMPSLGPNPTPEQEQKSWEAYHNRMVEITQGLFYEYRQSNGGGVTVAYDRERGRAYYQSSPR